MSEILVSAEGASKKFCRRLKKSLWYGLQDIAADVLGGRRDHDRLRQDEFWAVRNVSFEVQRGECLGLIGRNGAGKTTLLRMLNGLIRPNQGRITMHGQVGALIALGAGFNPILTGRENIYVNASVLGLSKREIDGKLEEIIDFADIREFIDAPLQSYSSGMQVRLGFAVATAIEPEILLLDEVLAVGDAGFRHKCYNRIGQMQKKCAVIFVSHSMDFVAQICDRVLSMREGAGTMHEDVMTGIEAYEADNHAGEGSASSRHRAFYPPIRDAKFRLVPGAIGYGDMIEGRLDLDVERPMLKPVVSFALRNGAGQWVAIWDTAQHKVDVQLPAGSSELRFPLGPMWLLPGKYVCSLSIREAGSAEHNLWLHDETELVVAGDGAPVPSTSVLLPYQGHRLVTSENLKPRAALDISATTRPS